MAYPMDEDEEEFYRNLSFNDRIIFNCQGPAHPRDYYEERIFNDFYSRKKEINKDYSHFLKNKEQEREEEERQYKEDLMKEMDSRRNIPKMFSESDIFSEDDDEDDYDNNGIFRLPKI